MPKYNVPDNDNNDIVIIALKERYFKLIKTENYPITSGVCSELDRLEKKIFELTKEQKVDNIT